MVKEQDLLTKWRNLPQDKQQQVLEFIESLDRNTVQTTALGKRLHQIRAKIVASGEPLLTQEEIEMEIASRRGGLQSTDK